MAFISDKAELGLDVVIGIHTVIEAGVKIGDNCRIGSNVVIKKDTVIGNNVRIDDGSVLGKYPMKSINSATTNEQELKKLIIGNNVIIGTSAVIYRGAYISNGVLIADLASVREKVKVGKKTIIGRGTAIENDSTIGANCKIETNCYITAFSIIEDYCFFAPNVSTSNDKYVARTEKRFKEYKGPRIKKGARVGVNATLLPGVILGEDSLVGAGSVVLKDVNPREVVAGNPAKKIKDVPEEQLLENQK